MSVRTWGDGRYEGQALLGRGGTAEVWRARDLTLGRDVAVKTFRAADVGLGSEEARFRSEIELLARLDHPAVIPLWDAGVTDHRPWCVLQLARGGSLAQRAPDTVPLRIEDVAVQIADALGYVHDQQIVHRDLKPANILLDLDGRAYLSDFGIARLHDATRLTGTGLLIGTAAYLAPEQVRGEAVGPAADVYALGLVLIEQFSGHQEYPGPPIEAALARLARSPELPRNLDPVWRRLLIGMTALDPRDRPSAAEVRAELTAPRSPVPLPSRAQAPARPEPVSPFRQAKALAGALTGGVAAGFAATLLAFPTVVAVPAAHADQPVASTARPVSTVSVSTQTPAPGTTPLGGGTGPNRTQLISYHTARAVSAAVPAPPAAPAPVKKAQDPAAAPPGPPAGKSHPKPNGKANGKPNGNADKNGKPQPGA